MTDPDAFSAGTLGELPAGTPLPLVPRPTGSKQNAAGDKQRGTQNVGDVHLKFAEETHQYVREYIRNADQKAVFFFAASTAGLGYVLTRGSSWFHDPALRLEDGVFAVAVLGLGLAAALFLYVVFPRLKSSSPGLIFFNEIAVHSSAITYTESALATPPDEIARTKLRHLYDLAQVSRQKYGMLRAGAWVGVVGGLAALLFLAIRTAK